MSVLDRIDPEYLPIVKMVPIIDLEDVAAARAALKAVFEAAGASPRDPLVVSADHHVPGWDGAPDVLVRTFRPADATGDLPALLWIQGGGYVLGAADLDDALCGQLAIEQQCLVASVAYRRAPEAPFPAASDDCYAAARWLFAKVGELDIDASRIAVGGASAGGGAAAALALRARDGGDFAFVHQLLIYPMIDDRNDSDSARRITDPELWSHKNNMLAWKAYLGDAHGSDDVSPYAAPSRATDLGGLPPAAIFVGELDVFLDESIDYARRLIAAGVSAELHLYPAVHHGFDVHKVDAATSRRFIADRSHALSRAFARPNDGGVR
ncbi:alpha/beta hydrolase [Sphingomonas sp. YL-JM2C]